MVVSVLVVTEVPVGVRPRRMVNLTDPAIPGAAELRVKDMAVVAVIATTNAATHHTAEAEARAVVGAEVMPEVRGQVRFTMGRAAITLGAPRRPVLVRHAIQALAAVAASTATATVVLESSWLPIGVRDGIRRLRIQRR